MLGTGALAARRFGVGLDQSSILAGFYSSRATDDPICFRLMTSEGQTRNHFSRILVATDGSEGATTALSAAIDLAAQARADLIVLNVFERAESSFIHAPEITEFAGDEHHPGGHDAEEIAARTILGEAKTIVDQRPGVSASFVFLEGDAAREILRYSVEVQADLIVLGRSGRNRIVGLVLGSVSQKVVSLAAQPTLIVPPASSS